MDNLNELKAKLAERLELPAEAITFEDDLTYLRVHFDHGDLPPFRTCFIGDGMVERKFSEPLNYMVRLTTREYKNIGAMLPVLLGQYQYIVERYEKILREYKAKQAKKDKKLKQCKDSNTISICHLGIGKNVR